MRMFNIDVQTGECRTNSSYLFVCLIPFQFTEILTPALCLFENDS